MKDSPQKRINEHEQRLLNKIKYTDTRIMEDYLRQKRAKKKKKKKKILKGNNV